MATSAHRLGQAGRGLLLLRESYVFLRGLRSMEADVPYLTLVTEAAPQRDHSLRELFNALRNVIRYAIAGRAMPNDLPR